MSFSFLNNQGSKPHKHNGFGIQFGIAQLISQQKQMNTKAGSDNAGSIRS